MSNLFFIRYYIIYFNFSDSSFNDSSNKISLVELNKHDRHESIPKLDTFNKIPQDGIFDKG